MPTTPFRRFTSPYVVLSAENVDTDQIIPARYLTTIERTGLGKLAFHDWRYRADDTPDPSFVLNQEGAAGARILVAGHNFGCGSSREHAVWALQGAGFDAVVSSRFADIFRGNALTNGLMPIEVSPEVIATLTSGHSASPGASLTVDLERQQLELPDGSAVAFPIAPFARHRLLHGIDEMEFILGAESDIDAYEAGATSAFSTRFAAGTA
jgi:3-isopropylmalate/(R)-2-methylmalate dehydratase small subunit